MARNSKRYKDRQSKVPPVSDRTLYFSDLTSLDPSLKNEVWAAQALFFMKRSGGSRLFLDPVKAATYRAMDRLDINEQEAKEMFDPKTPMGGGGEAAYVSSDWKANPIYIHLKNIVKADIEKTGKDLEVTLTDKYAKTRQMQENYKIIYRRAFRDLINKLATEIGLPPISEFQDPYKWADNLMKENDDVTKSPDMINKYVDLIKNQITDDQDMALYNELLYKGDYEMAFELGMKYYIFNLNKWQERWADEFINDIMHFNKACGEWYTDLITGRPVIERFVPEVLYTSPFRRKDGEDIQYYFTEYQITFGDFIRTIGKNLTPDKLRDVFILMKQQGVHQTSWQDSFGNFGVTNYSRDSVMVRMGRAAMLSTDMEVQMEVVSTGIRKSVPLTWEPISEDEMRIEKRYNVWRWWYYIPPNLAELNSANWSWQKDYIFNLQKFQDQQRHGDNGRYAKCPLVIYDNSSQATYSDIVKAFMPKINFLWHKYQNLIVNDVDASIMSDDLIGGLLGAVDEDNKINPGDPNKPTGGNGRDSYQEQWRMIKQAGTGFLKMRDKNGNPILKPQDLVVTIQNKFLDKAENVLAQMMMMYDFMVKSLAYSPMTAGEEVKPRTPVAALEQSLKATQSSRFFMQKGYEEFLVMYGERMIRYILEIFREKDTYEFPDRYEEFMENIGYANGLALEGLAELDPENIGLTVNYVDNTAKKEFVMQLASEYVKTKELTEDFLYLIMGIDNWKVSFVLMRMAIKQRKKELQEEQAVAHQRLMEQKNADLEALARMQQLKDAGKDQNIVTQGKVDEMVNSALNREKYMAQSQLKKETDELRRGENDQKANLSVAEKTHEKNLEQQMPIPA